ncbi:hypothetical protein [Candidatus Poriferisodalis sp.]|uniref:hypothetical protein n=1 Tax=Candidatus Poriferisodalis sp. TaxID=3101277 RepID=UPI003B522542
MLTAKYAEAMSYGQLDVEFVPVHQRPDDQHTPAGATQRAARDHQHHPHCQSV